VARRVPFSRAPVLLVANAFGTWLSQALANLVKARGYRVHFVMTGRELLEQAPAVQPDVVVLDADLPDLDSVAVCRTLRHNRAPWDMPVIMITTTPATKQQRLAALEAGAWDYLSVLLNPEELTMKVDAMAHLKLEIERTLQETAVDPASGLYTRRGLDRRARELTADAVRRHAPLACVVLGIGVDPKGAAEGAQAAGLTAAAAYAGQVLGASGRKSDCVGSLGQGEFAVLAPATAPEGAQRMARRLARVIETAGPRPADVLPLRVHAGYDVVRDPQHSPLEPASLLEHARAALHLARAGSGERIRAYQA
jgi:PleD family two-component response regulator